MLWWIQNAKQCGIGSLVRFAFGLQKDLSAVLAAVETPWSNAQVEGQMNRLKTIKRQMYGPSWVRSPAGLSASVPYRSDRSLLKRAP
jgi:transposase